jgi:hypothetical protein
VRRRPAQVRDHRRVPGHYRLYAPGGASGGLTSDP